MKVVERTCPECPFRRDSVQGYLGSAESAMDFLWHHWMGREEPLPCHMQVEWEAEGAQEKAQEAPLCRGMFSMMLTSCKLPRDQELTKMLDQVEPDPDCFGRLEEFVDYHDAEDSHG